MAYLAKITTDIQTAREKDEVIDPCIFWPTDGLKKYPILNRIASQVLAAEATSGETERIGSAAGVIYSPRRNRLKSETAEKMIFLQGVYLSEMPPSSRAMASKKSSKQFIKRQSITCQEDPINCSESFKKFLDGLCDWLYYEEEEEEEDCESNPDQDLDDLDDE